MANDYLVSFYYWCKRENKNAHSPTLILNDSIVGLRNKVEEWIEQCKELERNPLSISVRYVSGGRFGGSACQVLDCTTPEFFAMYKDQSDLTATPCKHCNGTGDLDWNDWRGYIMPCYHYNGTRLLDQTVF